MVLKRPMGGVALIAASAAIVISCGGATTGGSGPTEPQQEFECVGTINVPGGTPLTLPQAASGVPPLDICDLANKAPADLSAHCLNKCGSIITAYGADTHTDTSGFTCTIDHASPLPESCPNTDPPGVPEPPISGGPAQFVAHLSGNMHMDVNDEVCAIICVPASVSADSPTSAQFAYTIVPLDRNCPPQGCDLLVTALHVQINDFDIGGLSILGIDFVSPTHVSGMLIDNVGWVTGKWMPDGTFRIPANAGTVVVSATEGGSPVSFDRPNKADITGTIDPVTGNVSFDPFSQSESDTTIGIGLSGSNTTHPPKAAITLAPTVECNQTGGAAVTLDGTASTDLDNDISFYSWQVNGGAALYGPKVPATLHLGANDVALDVFDSTLAQGMADQPVTVVDTTPPTLAAVTAVTDTVCDPDSQTATITAPKGTDVCDPNVQVTGAVIATNGVTLATPIPINGGSVRVPAGVSVVQWKAVDASGNVSTVTQTLTVRPAIEASDSIEVAVGGSVRLPTSGFATVANRGHDPVYVGFGAQTGTILTEGSVFLDINSIVNGNVLAAGSITKQPLAKVTGTATPNTTVSLPAGLDLSGVVFPGSNSGNVNVLPGVTRTLAPGSYGLVVVAPLGTLVLTAGTYYVDSFNLPPLANLNLDQSNGAVVLYVRDTIIDQGQIAPVAGPVGGFVLGYAGVLPLLVASPFPGGTVIAPKAEVSVSWPGTNSFSGELFAKEIEVEANATLTCVAAH